LALCVAIAITAVVPIGCTTHQCDPSCLVLGGSNGPNCPVSDAGNSTSHVEGEQLVWESNAQDGPWLHFPGQRTYVITYPQPFACRPPEVSYQIATDVDHPQNGYVNGGAYLAQLSDASINGIVVTNPSCAGGKLTSESVEWGLRVVAKGVPGSSAASCRDTSGDAGDGSPTDSSAE
jgi:hypothetical protein